MGPGRLHALIDGVFAIAIAFAFASPLASFALDAAVAVSFALSRSAVPGLISRAALDGA